MPFWSIAAPIIGGALGLLGSREQANAARGMNRPQPFDQNTSQAPWGPAIPGLEEALAGAMDIYRQGPTPFPSHLRPRGQGMSGQTRGILEQIMARGMGQSPLVQAGQQFAMGALQPGGNNPILQDLQGRLGGASFDRPTNLLQSFLSRQQPGFASGWRPPNLTPPAFAGRENILQGPSGGGMKPGVEAMQARRQIGQYQPQREPGGFGQIQPGGAGGELERLMDMYRQANPGPRPESPFSAWGGPFYPQGPPPAPPQPVNQPFPMGGGYQMTAPQTPQLPVNPLIAAIQRIQQQQAPMQQMQPLLRTQSPLQQAQPLQTMSPTVRSFAQQQTK